MPTSIADPRLNAYQVWMGIADRTHSRSPERQNEIVLQLPLSYLGNGIAIEGLVRMVIDIELEEGLAPVMRSVRLG
jgi:hypothetical protein